MNSKPRTIWEGFSVTTPSVLLLGSYNRILLLHTDSWPTKRNNESISLRLQTGSSQSCLCLHESQYNLNTENSTYTLLEFYLPIPSEPIHDLTTDVSIILENSSIIFYQRGLRLKAPSVHLFTNDVYFTSSSEVGVGIYVCTDDGRPISDVRLSILVQDATVLDIGHGNCTVTEAAPVHSVAVGTGGTCGTLGSGHFVFLWDSTGKLTGPDGRQWETITNSKTDSNGYLYYSISQFHSYSFGHYGNWTISVSHPSLPTVEAAVRQFEVSSNSDGAVKRDLLISVTSSYNHSPRFMKIHVSVRRLGVKKFRGSIKIRYCLLKIETGCHHIKRETDDQSSFYVNLKSYHSLQQSDKILVETTAIEHQTGVIQIDSTYLEILKQNLLVKLDNIPDTFRAGEELSLSFFLWNSDTYQYASQECVLVKLISKPTTILSRELHSNIRGEVNLNLRVPANHTADITVQISSCSNHLLISNFTLRPFTASTSIASTTASLVSVAASKYSYNIGDTISLHLSKSHSLGCIAVVVDKSGVICSVARAAAGKIEVKVTEPMYPSALIYIQSSGGSVYSVGMFVIGRPLQMMLGTALSTPDITNLRHLLITQLPDEVYTRGIFLLRADNSKQVNSLYSQIFSNDCSTVENSLLRVQCQSLNYTQSTSCISNCQQVNPKPLSTSTESKSHIASSHSPKHGKSNINLRIITPLNSSGTQPMRRQDHSLVSELNSTIQKDEENFIHNKSVSCPHNKALQAQSQPVLAINRCSMQQSIAVQFPDTSSSDWLVGGVFVSPLYGVIPVEGTELLIHKPIYMTVKAPPPHLTEGEQFQLHINVISTILYISQCHVRLMLSNKEAFCFKNLMLNSYPHMNMTMTSDRAIEVSSFTASALRRGDYSITAELWVNGSLADSRMIHLHVAAIALDVDHTENRGRGISATSPNPTAFPLTATNLQLKMRYEKTSNQARCHGFRLAVTVGEERDSNFDYSNLFNWRRKRAISQHKITNISRHSIQVCYRILRKPITGSYYIDVESFTGYRPADDRLEIEGDSSCKVKDANVMAYERGRVIMLDSSSVSNDSWCCFTVILEATSDSPNSHFFSQNGQSAAVRMGHSSSLSSSGGAGDFCLEFYNLQDSRNPYSNHICSQHGCLCTEATSDRSPCKQIKTGSTRRATTAIAQGYLTSKYSVKVKVTHHNYHDYSGYTIDVAEVEQAYGPSYLDTGQLIHLYYRQNSRCQLFTEGNSYILQGRQLYIQHGDSVSIYVDGRMSIISLDEMSHRSDSSHISCFLSYLLCPSYRYRDSSNTAAASVTTSFVKSVGKSINSVCRKQTALTEDGADITRLINQTHSPCSESYDHIEILRERLEFICRWRKLEAGRNVCSRTSKQLTKT